MGECAKLIWNRKRLGLSQKDFAEKVGVSVNTIRKLESDETAWGSMYAGTADKIYAHFESMASWQPENAREVMREIREELNSAVEERESEPEPIIKVKVEDKGLTDKDKNTISLLEFAFDGLLEAVTHDEFSVYMNMLKRIVNKY